MAPEDKFSKKQISSQSENAFMSGPNLKQATQMLSFTLLTEIFKEK